MKSNFVLSLMRHHNAAWSALSLPALVFLTLSACSGAEHAPDPGNEDGSISGLVDASVEGGVADGHAANDDAGMINDANIDQDSGNTTVDASTSQDSGHTTADASTSQDSGNTTVDASTAQDSSTPSCQSDRQCNTGSICLSGNCVEGCRIDEDCPGDQPKCENGANPPGRCVECLIGSDCQAPLNSCVNGSCTQTCNNPGDCQFPTVCDDSQGLCVRCIDNSQCLTGSICEANDCVPGCQDDQGCATGQICSSGACVDGCRDDTNCLDGMICANNNCRLGCRPATANSADTCPLEMHCDANSLTCQAGCTDAINSNNQCPANETCLSDACYAACQNGQCPDGEHCDTGYCRPGCVGGTCGNNQVCDASQEPLGECVECYAGDTSVCDSSPISKFCNTDIRECTAKCTDQQSTFYCQSILGWICDENNDNFCVECLSDGDCNDYQHCDTNINSCINDSTRPFCAPCENDADCGGEKDLCVVNDLGPMANEKVCTTDCSLGQSCPSGTACLPIGDPVRGLQCMPVNSVMDAASCAGREDLITQTSCGQWGQWCGLPQIQDAICSGYGASADHCTVFCDPNQSNDCPEGFFCEDPPQQDNRDPDPRCAPIH